MPLFQPKNHVLLDAREVYAHSIRTYRSEKCWSLIFGPAYTAPQIQETKRSREAETSPEPFWDDFEDFDDDGNPY